MDRRDMLLEAQKCFQEVHVIFGNPQASAEDMTKAENLLKAGKNYQAKAAQLSEVQNSLSALDEDLKGAGASRGTPAQVAQAVKFARLREFWCAVSDAGNMKYRGPLHPALSPLDFRDPAEPRSSQNHGAPQTQAWESKTTMAEGTGATGGFLVPEEFRAELYAVPPEDAPVRSRATVIPMRRRSLRVPVLDQTGTTSGQPHWFGGMHAHWAEEGSLKTQSDPKFRQIELVAHKLVCYTRSTDEMMDDTAVSLDAFLRGPMGFTGAINWNEEYAFLQGTGVGMPLGVINAGATIAIAAQGNPPAPATFYTDLVNMFEAFLPGSRGIWMLNIRHASDLLLMNGPAGTPQYLWGGAVAGPAAQILGFPFIFTEKLPLPGNAGSVVLADWRYYLVGDRQATTIDSTNIERFQYDETSWRAVHRVDGQPWLSAPLTLQDGATQVSPFVILGAKTTQ